MSDDLAIKILEKATEGPQPYHALREAINDAAGRAALAIYDRRMGEARDAFRDLKAAEEARELLVAIGGPEGITRAGKGRDKAEYLAARKEEAAEAEAVRAKQDADLKRKAEAERKKAADKKAAAAKKAAADKAKKEKAAAGGAKG